MAENGDYVQVGWLHSAYSTSHILTDSERATLEARYPTDHTYVDGWVPVFVPMGAHIGRSTLAEKHQAHYRSCGCLGDSAICCDPTCECHEADVSGRLRHWSEAEHDAECANPGCPGYEFHRVVRP